MFRDVVELHAKDECVAIDPRTVRCPGSRHVAYVDLDDGDDVWDTTCSPGT